MEPDGRAASGADAARIVMTDDAVLALVREHFTGIDAMYLCPNIPGKKELVARSVHARHLPSDERVLALFDDTVFGSGDHGFLVTSRRVCWNNAAATPRPQMLEWRNVDPDRMYAERNKLTLGAGAIELSGDELIAPAFEAAFHVLAFSARMSPKPAAPSGVILCPPRISDRPTVRPSRPATAPPPHAVAYESYVVHARSQRGPKFECWDCHTPLHWSTPQCSHCSARPTTNGWQRTG